MKKLVFLFGASVLALTSCSKDSTSSTTSQSAGLIKTMTDSDGTSTATYNGSKLVKTEATGMSATYTYTGDLITTMTYTEGDNINSTEYTYANGKVTASVDKSNNGSGTTMTVVDNSTFTYNTDGTITVSDYMGNDTSSISGSTKYTFQNGNMMKQENFDDSGLSSGVTTYEYDAKKNPLNNITGFAKVLNNEEVGVNNIVKSTEITGSDVNLQTTVITNVYTYNADGYPLSMTTTQVYTIGSSDPQTTTTTTHYTY